MAKLYWRYATMNAGKSADVLKTYHNYIEQGKVALLFTSHHENRFGEGYLGSRMGIKEKAKIFNEDTDFYKIMTYFKQSSVKIYCVVIDEAQFLTKNQVLQLRKIVNKLNIPVICFGLRTDFQQNLFEGSLNLFAHAHRIEEMKTICWFCGSKSIYNLRVEDEKPVFNGDQISIGDNADKKDKSKEKKVSYLPVCSCCYDTIQETGELIHSVKKDDPKKFKEKMVKKIWDVYEDYEASKEMPV